MSTRRMLNTALGAVTLLLVACVVIVWNAGRIGGGTETQIQLAQQQQALIQDLSRDVEDLAGAEDLDQVAESRKRLGKNVWQYDHNLAALMFGGTLAQPDGTQVQVPKAAGARSRAALDEAAKTWIETGKPLADLAAGEFSTFSAAGQQAVQTLRANNILLMQHMGTLATVLREDADARRALSRTALWAAGGFAAMLLGLIGLRVVQGRAARRAQDRPRTQPDADPAAATEESSARRHARERVEGPQTPYAEEPEPSRRTQTAHPAAAGTMPGARTPEYRAPVDFASVSASVDQISVDMNTIASSTDKMRSAIDSVGHALQGMLSSLNEMAQDSAEGGKIVRGANNAASFTSEAAEELVASAREMSQVVARVTRLALRTKQIAAQIDAEALATGRTGSALTSVVAGEVKGLARQTAEAAARVEDTVAEILISSRRHEEAIGQIITNIAAINKVSRNLGQLMLSPPPRVVPGAASAAPAPLPEESPADHEGIAAAFAAEPQDEVAEAPAPAPDEAFTFDDDFLQAAQDVQETQDLQDVPDLQAVADETRNVIAEIIQEVNAEPEPAGADTEALIPGVSQDKERPEDPPAHESPVADLPPIDAPVAAPVAAPVDAPGVDSTPAPALPDAEAPLPPGIQATGSSANVFMLNKPKRSAAPPAAAQAPAQAATAPPAPALTAPAQAGAATPASPAPAEGAAKDGAPTGVFVLDSAT